MKANKGWINEDIFLDLSPSDETVKQKKEAARITLLWSPINSLLSNIFLILILCSILVFTSLSFVKGRFDFNLSNYSINTDRIQLIDHKYKNKIHSNDLNSINLKTDQNLAITDIDKPNTISALDDNKIISNKEKSIDNIYKKEIKIKDIENTKDIKILQNKKSKSNFI